MRRLLLVLAITFAACGDDGGNNNLPDAPEFPDDTDGDGVPDALDNCDDAPNANQVDTDGDDQGDACDDDDDNDGIADAADNCSLVANADQANADGDAEGDACDGDADGDTVANEVDNCPLASNTDQVNTDADTEGDACDADDDNDTILDAVDNCPLDANTDQTNSDTDNLGNACDTDDDNDTILDGVDNCPLDANTDQTNSDTDTLGNACDTDDDGDSIEDVVDNCPIDSNDQSDLDDDGLGDLCDPDDDNDTVLDGADNCPTVPNTTQDDGNGNGLGDACDGVVNPSFEDFVVGGNVVAKGAGWSGRFDGTNVPGTAKTSVDIVIAGIPAGAQIRKASLYWTTIGIAFPTVTMDTVSVTGVEIGQTGDTCWGIGNNFMYRADVTPLVAGNGTFTLTDILSRTDLVNDGQGASLVVIYVDPADTRTNFISISDGAVGFVGGGATTSVANGFTVGGGFDKATAINVVADGQQAGDDISFQGISFGGGDAFIGAEQAMWDTRIDDITSAITPGTTEITTAVNGFGDCLAWSMSAIVIEDINDPGAPQAKRAPAKQPTALQTFQSLMAKAKARAPQSRAGIRRHGRIE